MAAEPLYIRIKSFNRPNRLRGLLNDIYRERPLSDLWSVIVFDDGSKVCMNEAAELCEKLGFTFRSLAHHGKQRAWALHNQMYETLREIEPEALVFFMDDDMRLCDRFFERAIGCWQSIADNKKMTLHLSVDSARDGKVCWTNFRPVKTGSLVRKTQWVDGTFMCGRSMLEQIGWKVDEIKPSRWKRDPNRSTGVGAQLSARLHRKGLALYEVIDSLALHVGFDSYYNETERARRPLRTVRFVGGNDAARRLERRDMAFGSMATFPPRKDALRLAVASLLPQLDVLQIYLNGYKEVPEFLKHPRIITSLERDGGDLGDAGKFFWCESASGYQFHCDDDIIYPDDYIDLMANAIERYERKAIVGVHGVLLRADVWSYYRDRNVRHFAARTQRDEPMHLLGTGTVAYHSSTLSLSRSDFVHANMADIFVGLAAQRQHVPMVSLARRSNWLRPIETKESIYDLAVKDDSVQTELLHAVWPWSLYCVARRSQKRRQAAAKQPKPAQRQAQLPVRRQPRPNPAQAPGAEGDGQRIGVRGTVKGTR